MSQVARSYRVSKSLVPSNKSTECSAEDLKTVVAYEETADIWTTQLNALAHHKNLLH